MKKFNFFKRWTKWMAMYIYTYDRISYMVMGRLNTRNGLIQFKTIKINRVFGIELLKCPMFNFEDMLVKLINS